MKKIISLVALASLSASTVWGAEVSAALPCITYRGSLVEAESETYPAGVGQHTRRMTFRVYDTDVQGADPLWTSPREDVTVNPDGTFEAKVGDETLAALITTGTVSYVGLQLGTSPEITPRRALRPVATATRAIVAEGGSPDMKIGTLSTTTVGARNLSVSLAEISGSLIVEAGKIRVEPFELQDGETTRLLRGKGMKVFASGRPTEIYAWRYGVKANEELVTAPADGVALVHCVGYRVRIPGTIQFCRKGDLIRAPTAAENVKVSFWEFAK